jgi:hypothetical protein
LPFKCNLQRYNEKQRLEGEIEGHQRRATDARVRAVD